MDNQSEQSAGSTLQPPVTMTAEIPTHELQYFKEKVK